MRRFSMVQRLKAVSFQCCQKERTNHIKEKQLAEEEAVAEAEAVRNEIWVQNALLINVGYRGGPGFYMRGPIMYPMMGRGMRRGGYRPY